MKPHDDIAGAVRSHARLLDALDRLDDETAAQPSLLPGWDIVMVVTHLARNADSHTRMLEAATRGVARRQYESVEARAADIDAARGRPATEAVADLRASCHRLEHRWEHLPVETWSSRALTTAGDPNPVADLPFQRWREVEVHLLDLGLGFTAGEWDGEYVAAELDAAIALLPERLPPGAGAAIRATDSGREWTVPEGGRVTMHVEAAERALVAWLLGREIAGFPEVGPWRAAPRR